ncbi:MAG: hypothetical protein GXO07_02480 [Crenarchaeota archaeon]|nr:hypothetical protein [Thermoproteota archaeon]
MKARKRVYEVGEVTVDGVKLPVLRLKESTEVDLKRVKGDAYDALTNALHRELIEMEEKGLVEGYYVEFEAKSGKLVVRAGGGRGLKGELAKWPVRLKRAAVLRTSPKEVDLEKLRWVKFGDNVFVYEGRPEGDYKAVLLDTEDGMYVVLSDKAIDEEVKEWEFEDEGAEEGEEQ